MENLKEASGETQAQARPQSFLVYNWYFFQNSRFTEIIQH